MRIYSCSDCGQGIGTTNFLREPLPGKTMPNGDMICKACHKAKLMKTLQENAKKQNEKFEPMTPREQGLWNAITAKHSRV